MCRARRLRGWSALGFALATLSGCGATSHTQGDGQDPGDSVGGTSFGGSGITDGATAGSGPVGGSATQSGINLTGDPRYFRFVRLTNSQWAASVQEVLKLPEPSGLEQGFISPVFGTTDFSNNESLLDVNARTWSDFS